ncbi:MAG TPA: hypothetical protein VJZ00_00320 [Thermoanaerobaculia bacterium]|nr:hypothetical protein [Thermoanaerobaculia bacterium]
MRALILIASLAVSLVASAEQFQYIVPLSGYLSTDDGTYYYATTVVQNLSPREATVSTVDVYPLNGASPCVVGAPFAVPASGRVSIGPVACFGNVSAIQIVSTEKLRVHTEIDTHATRVSGWDKQLIDAPSAWIPAGTTAVTEAIIRDDGPRKANLLVINPSFQTLTLNIEMERPELDRSSARTIDVPAHSARLIPLEEVRNPSPPPFVYSVEGRHLLRITGNGDWQGGVSSIYKGPSMYVPAVALEP